MINYNIVMLGNPSNPEEPKKAYSVAQYTEKMTLEDFSEHISDHNNVYDAEDVQAVLGKAMKCLREMLLAGKKVELGKLGEFYVTLQGEGSETAKAYNPDIYVTKVNVVWSPGKDFENLKNNAVFNFVPSRDEQREAKRRAKAQDGSSSSATDKTDTTPKDDTSDKTDTTAKGDTPTGEDSDGDAAGV